MHKLVTNPNLQTCRLRFWFSLEILSKLMNKLPVFNLIKWKFFLDFRAHLSLISNLLVAISSGWLKNLTSSQKIPVGVKERYILKIDAKRAKESDFVETPLFVDLTLRYPKLGRQDTLETCDKIVTLSQKKWNKNYWNNLTGKYWL